MQDQAEGSVEERGAAAASVGGGAEAAAEVEDQASSQPTAGTTVEEEEDGSVYLTAVSQIETGGVDDNFDQGREGVQGGEATSEENSSNVAATDQISFPTEQDIPMEESSSPVDNMEKSSKAADDNTEDKMEVDEDTSNIEQQPFSGGQLADVPAAAVDQHQQVEQQPVLNEQPGASPAPADDIVMEDVQDNIDNDNGVDANPAGAQPANNEGSSSTPVEQPSTSAENSNNVAGGPSQASDPTAMMSNNDEDRPKENKKKQRHPASDNISGNGNHSTTGTTASATSSTRSSKRGRKPRLRQSESTDEDLETALRLSMEQAQSPRSGRTRYGRVSAAASCGLMKEVSREDMDEAAEQQKETEAETGGGGGGGEEEEEEEDVAKTEEAILSPLVNQVVRLTAEGRKQLEGTTKALGVDQPLFFVFTYKPESHWCELVPMRTVGKFSTDECGAQYPECVGRDKWVLFSEEACKGLTFEVGGDSVEIVEAKTVANTEDADEEQWDILGDIGGKDNTSPNIASGKGVENKSNRPGNAIDPSQLPAKNEGGDTSPLPSANDSAPKNIEDRPVAAGEASSPPPLQPFSQPKYKRNHVVYSLDEGEYYKAYIKKVGEYDQEQGWKYFIHYNGWAKRYDKWVPESALEKEIPKAAANSAKHSIDSTVTTMFAKCSGTGCPASSKGDGVSTVVSGGEEMWQVERVIGRRWNTQSHQIEYLTQWVDCPDPTQNTWEPQDHFDLLSLDVFERMWGQTRPPPLDGTAEMLSEKDIIKMSAIKHEGKSTTGPGDEQGHIADEKAEIKPKKEDEAILTSRSRRSRSTTRTPTAIKAKLGLGVPGTVDQVEQPVQPSSRRSTRKRTLAQKPEDAEVKEASSRPRRSRKAKEAASSPPKRAENLKPASKKKEVIPEPAAYIQPPVDPEGARASHVEWTPVNECILLHSALEYPEDLIALGAGLWMIEKSVWEFEGVAPSTTRQIRQHFEVMVKRDCKKLGETSALNYACHVLNAALAGLSPAAKNVALVAAGWYRVPGGPSCELATWHRPGNSLSSYHKMSNMQYIDRSHSLEQAWEEHMAQIRDGIEEAWIPTTKHEEEEVEEEILVEAELREELQNETHLQRQRQQHDEDAEWAKYKTMMMTRKNSLLKGDPRPSLTCQWCGPKQYDSYAFELKEEEQLLEFDLIPAGCKACRYLEELGWRFNVKMKILSAPVRRRQKRRHLTDTTYITPDGYAITSVKKFLHETTPIVAEEFIKNHVRNTPEQPPIHQEKKGEEMEIDQNDKQVEEPKKGEEQEEEVVIDAPQPTAGSTISRPALPTFTQLLSLERGLVSALAADELNVWNANYGSNSNVAVYTLRSLATGKLPHPVQFETPFFRSQKEMNVLSRLGGAPPTRFLGVARVMECIQIEDTQTVKQYSGRFGVEFPLFDVDKEPSLPQSATVRGRKVLIRNDLTEDVAGKLFAFIFRLLYGSQATEKCLRRTNALAEQTVFVQDTLRAFRATI